MTFKLAPLMREKCLASSIAFTKSSDMISTRSFLISPRGGIDSAVTDTVVPFSCIIFLKIRTDIDHDLVDVFVVDNDKNWY